MKSNFFTFPTWVKVEIWMPVGNPQTTQRAVATMTLNPKPYHEHEFEYTLVLQLQQETRTLTRLLPFRSQDIEQLFSAMLGEIRRVRFREFREKSWQLWKTKNEVKQLRTDYLGNVAGICLLGALGSLFLLSLGPLSWLLVSALIGAVYWLFRAIRKRKLVVKTEGKPVMEPRALNVVDSWQTVVFGIGDQATRFTERLFQVLKAPPTPKFRAQVETMWYWGVDGKEERDQIVVMNGRAILFAQIYRYGKDLYVGWDGYLNRGQWVEQTIAKGIDRNTGLLTAITCVQPGTQAVSEYDLVDLNCLMEWTHAQLVKLCKSFLAELKIDQEIDFKILRGERQGLLSEEQQQPRKKKRFFERMR